MIFWWSEGGVGLKKVNKVTSMPIGQSQGFILPHIVYTCFLLLIIYLQIDLDTIDVSNLNRQFLFQKRHVGKSKAKVSWKVVWKNIPKVKLEMVQDHLLVLHYKHESVQRKSWYWSTRSLSFLTIPTNTWYIVQNLIIK